jgi:hypothetical protein
MKALFEGLVTDENGNAAPVAYVGSEPTYLVVEDGFKYHVDARTVDEQVMRIFAEQLHSNKGEVSAGMLKMLGKDDLFTKISIDNQLKNFDKHVAQLYKTGIPEQGRMYLGMMGFRVVINRHGDLVKLDMPAAPQDEGEL